MEKLMLWGKKEWYVTTTDEVIETVKRSGHLFGILSDFCRICSREQVVQLYVSDIGLLVRVIFSDVNSEDSGIALCTRCYAPRCNPTANIEDYTQTDSENHKGNVDSITSMIHELSFKYTDTPVALEERIAKDYIFYNKYTLYDSLHFKGKYILYFDVEQPEIYPTIDKEISYDELYAQLKVTPVISRSEGGVYYLDDTQKEAEIIFAKYDSVALYGDHLYSTRYFLVSKGLDKDLIPAENVSLLVDTMELAVLFMSDSKVLPAGNEPEKNKEIAPFSDPTVLSDKDIIDTALQNSMGYDEDYDLVAFGNISKDNTEYYTDENSGNTPREKKVNLVVVPLVYQLVGTDFCLAFSVNDNWVYDNALIEYILESINLREVYLLQIKKKRFHVRDMGIISTPFTCDLYFTDTANVDKLFDLARKNAYDVGIVINKVAKDYISFWTLVSTLGFYRHYVFIFDSNGRIICGRYHGTSEVSEDTSSLDKNVSVRCSYISQFLISFIHAQYRFD